MSLDEPNRILGTTHIFVLRVWVELREIPGAAPEYRVAVEHIPGGEQAALTDLNQIPTLIMSYFRQDLPERKA
jgi:hypothetical protein